MPCLTQFTEFERGTLNQDEFREFAQRLGPHIERLLAEGSQLGVRGVSKSCENILAHRDALWIFVDHPWCGTHE